MNNLSEEVKDLYSENYNSVKKAIEEDTNKLKQIPYLCVGTIHIKSILPKAVCTFNTIPI